MYSYHFTKGETLRRPPFCYAHLEVLTLVTSLHFTSRPHDPFDDSAVERQRRMGLLTETGGVEEGALAVLSRVYAGLFLDHLCDSTWTRKP